jgi:site-specific recombinase XerD
LGPLAAHASDVRRLLEAAGYAPATVGCHLQLLEVLDAGCQREHVSAENVTDEVVDRLVHGRVAANRPVTLRRMGPVLSCLRLTGAIAPEAPVTLDWAGQLVADYREYLLTQRRLAALTTQNRTDLIARFVRAMMATRGIGWDVGTLRTADLHAFVFDHATRATVAGTRTVAETLRCFCRFLFATGRTRTDLSGTVPAPAGFRQAELPKWVEFATANALLDACDRDTVVGLRDAAVLTLMLRLGLRANEIACLRLQDLHWRTGEIEVAGKGGRRDRLPLPPDVGQALVAYLQRRPSTDSRAVFLRAIAPAGPLSRNGVVFIPRSASQRAGLPQIVGAHRLRHTAATTMLRGGASLREVGQVLRHHRDQVTSNYARVDLAALTPVARPWPEQQR